MKKVLLIGYHFPPDAAIGAVRLAKFAKYLPEFGWDPLVYSLKERYYEACDFSKVEPGLERIRVHRGTLFPGLLQVYSDLKQMVTRSRSAVKISGVVDAPMTKQVGYLKRLASSLLRVPDEHQGWILNVAIDGYRIAKKYKVDAVVTSGPPMSTHLGGVLLRKLTGIRWVADFRDPWVSAPSEAIRPDTDLTRSLNKRLESWVVHHADRIISTTESATNYFRSILGPNHHGKCVTIPNGFDDDDFRSIEGPLAQGNSRIKMIYAGSFYANRNPEPFFAALQSLDRAGRIAGHHIDIELIGNCYSYRGRSVPALIEEYGLQSMVRTLGNMPYRECLGRMLHASALLLFAQGQPDQIPGKVFDYFRINRPIFAITEEGETKRILEPFVNAFVADPDSVEDIAAKFLELIKGIAGGAKSLGADGKIQQYHRRELARKFAGYLE